MPLRILMIGDVVGRPGRQVIAAYLPGLIREWDLHLVVANAENAASGSGLTAKAYHELTQAGVDVFTMGDHIYRKKEIFPLLETTRNICKPANYPAEAPGQEYVIASGRHGIPVAVFSVLGRLFMKPVDCPFRAADAVLGKIDGQARCILLDVHAEATSEKQLLGRYLDGRASGVVGTHTHVATADERLLPGGTAYQSDLGMTGPYESILGRRIDRVMYTTLHFTPTAFDVADGPARIHGAVLELDAETGRALRIQRVAVDAERPVPGLAGG